MEVTLKRIGDDVHLRAANENGKTADFDNAGGSDGMSPMEMLLGSVAACSSIDLVPILRKQRQDLKDLEVKVTSERHPVGEAKPFKSIHMHFIMTGTIDPKKAERAVSLSVEKYCSVGRSLDPDIAVSHSFEIKPE